MGYLFSMKTCRDCNISKELGEFYVHKMMADGHLNKCKDCVKSRVGRHREANLDQVREYDRERGRLDHRKAVSRQHRKNNPEYHLAANERYQKRYPEKKFARHAVNNAVRDGKLLKQSCEVCGDSDSEGHHDDYSKPLEVRWLCDTHHKQHHREERNRLRAAGRLAEHLNSKKRNVMPQEENQSIGLAA